jgi:hypothetical protein
MPMNEFEQDLRSLRRSEPSPELDGRMAAVFAQAKHGAPRLRVAPWWWWGGAGVGLAAAAAVAVLLHRPATSAPELRGTGAAVYRIETRAPLRALLLEPAHAARTPPRVFVSVSTPAP